MELHNQYVTIIILCLIVIFSHLFDALSQKIKTPSVLLLLIVGLAMKYITGSFNVTINLELYLPLFGIIGLMLIVLDAATDLKIEKEKLPVIWKTFLVALITLVATAAAIMLVTYIWTGCTWSQALVNAIPLAVISSAIAIPAVRHLDPKQREFVTYEATFSDILGIMFFNMAVQYTTVHLGLLSMSFIHSIGILIISIISSFILMVLIRIIKSQVKFVFILSVLLLVYALGKMLHLSALVLVFIFGLLLNNWDVLSRTKMRIFGDGEEVKKDIDQFRMLIGEATFLVRTFFFVIFGYSMDILGLFQLKTIMLGTLIVGAILGVRYLYFRYLLKAKQYSELFIAPRGLVTILLFYSIPTAFKIPIFEQGVVSFVVIATSVLMLITTVTQKNGNNISEEEEIEEMRIE